MRQYIEKNGLKTHLLYKGKMCKLHYPEGWKLIEYSTYVGSFVDSKGKKYDLGYYKRKRGSFIEISNATVYGNKGGEYNSGCLDYLYTGIKYNKKFGNPIEGYVEPLEWYKDNEAFVECYKRCLELGVFDDLDKNKHRGYSAED